MIGKFPSPLEHSLYFHIPFCRRKCPYCHFYVRPNRVSEHQLLFNSFAQHLSLLTLPTLTSIYFGGGTPYLFGPENISKILFLLPYSPKTEITLEANPEDITLSTLQKFRAAGINRLSIGVQSLDDDLLKKLGRNHTAQKAIEAIETGEKAGFSNITIDLMFDLPSQTLSSWEKTLAKLPSLPITHLSLYNLTIEPNTPFHRKRSLLLPTLPTEEESLKIWQLAEEKLSSFGFIRYEISAFAKPSYHSIHNTGYWTARPFTGIGPSAFSYLNGKRLRTPSNLKNYQQRLEKGLSPYDFEEELPYPANLHELLAVHLRILEGVDLQEFEKHHSPLPKKTRQTLSSLIDKGYLEENPLRLTAKGIRFYDDVATELI